MKRIFKFPLLLILAIAFTFALAGCKKDNDNISWFNTIYPKLDTLTFKHSEKGWELYSWPVNSSYRYSLMIGTNATKSLAQVSNNPICVTGEDSLKVILSKLPEGEEIFWLGQLWIGNMWQSSSDFFMLPPKKIIIDIKEFCDRRNLKLTVEE